MDFDQIKQDEEGGESQSQAVTAAESVTFASWVSRAWVLEYMINILIIMRKRFENVEIDDRLLETGIW